MESHLEFCQCIICLLSYPFEILKRVLRIFGPKRDKVTVKWRKLHNEELNYLYCSLNIARVIKIKKNEMGGACGVYGGGERCVQGFGQET